MLMICRVLGSDVYAHIHSVGLGRTLKMIPLRMDAEDCETWVSSGFEGGDL